MDGFLPFTCPRSFLPPHEKSVKALKFPQRESSHLQVYVITDGGGFWLAAMKSEKGAPLVFVTAFPYNLFHDLIMKL